MSDHVHMLLSIPPKYSVAQVVGFIKGKSAIHIARNFVGRRKNFTGQHFWRAVITFQPLVEMKQHTKYIQKQEEEDRRIDQLQLFEEGRHL